MMEDRSFEMHSTSFNYLPTNICNDFTFKIRRFKEHLFQVLVNPLLNPCINDEDLQSATPQFKITNYIIYGDCGHMVALDDGFIESGKQIFIECFVKPVYSDDDTVADALSVTNLGPLVEWWFTGFDGSDNVVLGADTAYASYVFSKPSAQYRTIVDKMLDKLYLSKITIEFLTKHPDASYEDLLVAVKIRSCNHFDEESLMRHSKFDIQQVINYDEAGDDDEPILMQTTAMNDLMDLSGVKNDDISCRNDSIVRKDMRRAINSDTLSVSTHLVHQFFDEIFYDVIENKKLSPTKKSTKRKFECVRRSGPTTWMNDRLDIDNELLHYSKVKINFDTFAIGDCITFMRESGDHGFGQIKRLFQAKNRSKCAHVQILLEGKNTILADTAHNQELFLVFQCENVLVTSIQKLISVQRRNEKPFMILSDNQSDSTYFCNKVYDMETGAFEDISEIAFQEIQCDSCIYKNLKDANNQLTLDIIKKVESKMVYSHVYFRGSKIESGCVVMLSPDAYEDADFFHNIMTTKPMNDRSYDEKIYTERYRKSENEVAKGSLHDMSIPNKVCMVKSIFKQRNDIMIEAMKLHRAENVVREIEKIVEIDLNELFYTEERIVVNVKQVLKVCKVSLCKEENMKYFYMMRHSNMMPLTDNVSLVSSSSRKNIIPSLNNNRRFNSLDLFGGCENGEKLPQKGEVEMILAGPPCQGFSGMNRFSTGQYSLFKNSLIVTLLSYVDYFRPSFVVIENVRNLFKFKKSMVLKLTIACLLRMNYQVRFGVLQAGFYGVPQARKRAIILAVAPGKTLPKFPEPLFCFSTRCAQPTIKVDGKTYSTKLPTVGLHRALTVRDAVSDLANGSSLNTVNELCEYACPPKTMYQRMSRKNVNQLCDHVCKPMSHLSKCRIEHIPLKPAADWRDLPNVSLTLADGKVIQKLEYNYVDVNDKNGHQSNNRKRGVCGCMQTGICNSHESRQEGTLIPWCLVHTAHKNYQWSGLYGRLDWNGYFPTTVTNPEPISKQGMVLHPSQHRVMSVRELARSQGFPDEFIFSGNIMDRYRQIGNAVPVPLAKALAEEFNQV